MKITQKKLVIKENSTKTIFMNSLENRDIHINKNSILSIMAILKKGSKEPKNLNFYLADNSQLKFFVIILGTKNNSFVFTTTCHHIGKNSIADCVIKSILSDESLVDYKGNIKIPTTGENTISHLTHKSLMFSNKAHVNTLPSLEIEADSVKAGHSASIGRMDEEMLFYLQSRGLSKKIAEKLLLQSFIEEDLDQFKDKDLLLLIKKQLTI